MLLLATALNDWDWNFPSPGAPDPSMTQTSRVSPSSFSLIPSFPTSVILCGFSLSGSTASPAGTAPAAPPETIVIGHFLLLLELDCWNTTCSFFSLVVFLWLLLLRYGVTVVPDY
uniref:Uncharacterized protein n=1 Tax=Oryza barthii TaxID=65489 RepID=A0A0D3FKA7_9ORYZ